MCGGVTVQASDGWWQDTHLRPFVPRSWKNAFMVASVSPAVFTSANAPLGSGKRAKAGIVWMLGPCPVANTATPPAISKIPQATRAARPRAVRARNLLGIRLGLHFIFMPHLRFELNNANE